MFQLTLPIDPKLHSHNSGHWRMKASYIREARGLARILADKAGEPIAGPAVVDYLFTVPDRVRRDTANLVQSCKPLIDGVVDAGMISGDHWEALRIGLVSVRLGDRLEVTLIFRSDDQPRQARSKAA